MERDARDDRWLAPLALCSGLACAALLGRVALSDSGRFLFLGWNLMLAWAPYLLARCAVLLWRSSGAGRLGALAAGAGWLLFFPNAPYLVTDFVHLRHAAGVPWWYDVGLLALFAWAGCFLAAASLDAVQSIVRDAAGRAAAWLFVLAAAGLGGLGVYMGRFQRWNSWDALLDPHTVLSSVAATLLDAGGLRQAAGVSAMFAALVVVCYVTITAPARRAG